MKIRIIIISALLLTATAFTFQVFESKATEPWKPGQLLQPSALAATLRGPAAKHPHIYSIGPGGNIKGTVHLGPAQEKANLDKLKTAVSVLDRDAEIVIYCGCCPFQNCPNVRPAFSLLNEMNFTNHSLLNLSRNLKTDWIDKKYPTD